MATVAVVVVAVRSAVATPCCCSSSQAPSSSSARRVPSRRAVAVRAQGTGRAGSAAAGAGASEHRSPPAYSYRLAVGYTAGAAAGRSAAHGTGASTALAAVEAAGGSSQALIFDCDGVILESEDLHRRAYNDAFKHFDVVCPEGYRNPSTGATEWTEDFYDDLQNRVGGGKPKMRWYFSSYGWPTSKAGPAPTTQEQQDSLIDLLQDWKTSRYQQIIAGGEVQARPGIVQLIDEAFEKGVKVAVCSAATKSSVIFVLSNLLGQDRFNRLDCFLAGDDVDKKKPDPKIYKVAAKHLGVDPASCVVVEDSLIGLQAAKGAGMRCVITYTSSTRNQDFSPADLVLPEIGNTRLSELMKLADSRPALA
eukprot:jgi/Chlat1/5036/Chrsp329S04917